MEFEDRFTFKGSLSLPGAEASAVIALLQQARFDPCAPLAVHLIGGDWAPFWQIHPLPELLELQANDSLRSCLQLSKPTANKLHLSEAEFNFSEWTSLSSLSELPAGTRIKVEIELSSSGLVRDRRNAIYKSDGSIERIGSGDPELKWKFEDRDWTLGIRYHAQGRRNEGVKLTPIGSIETEWTLSCTTPSLTLLDEITAAIVDPLRIFSFLSRERVPWYRIAAHCIGENQHRIDTAVRRATVAPRRRGGAGPMFTQAAAAENAFPRLLAVLSLTPCREHIARAIDFVVASWCAETMSSSLVLLHAALETIIAIVEEEHMRGKQPSTRQWKNLDEAVRKAIKATTSDGGWDSVVVEYILSKTAELRRPPVIKLIKQHVSSMEIDTRDLWSNAEEFARDLGQAFEFRNNLVHAASASEDPLAVDRLFRLTLLTERLILRALGIQWCPQ